jgi:hypothetical protein
MGMEDEGARPPLAMQEARLKLQAVQGIPGRFHGNQYTRRTAIRMLLLGGSFRAVARKHPGREEGLTQDIRETILGGE